jgi:hypothetical protein
VGLGFVQVFEIRPFPEEAFAGGVLNALDVDSAGVEDGFLLGTEVFADNGDDADGSEEAASLRS